jgi:hypothetical protein
MEGKAGAGQRGRPLSRKGTPQMDHTELHYHGSRTSSYILRLTLNALQLPIGRRFTQGLPAGTTRLDRARLIVGATPCTVPLFHEAMERAARTTGYDVLVARHGIHPEVLDPVAWDVVMWSGDHTVLLKDLILYSGEDGYWLVPSRMGAHIRLASDGLHLEAEPSFKTWHQRCDGVCKAAREIVLATRGTEVL